MGCDNDIQNYHNFLFIMVIIILKLTTLYFWNFLQSITFFTVLPIT